MTGKSHVVVGAAMWGTFGLAPSISDAMWLYVPAMLGALLPDIDHQGSIAGRKWKAMVIPIFLIFYSWVAYSIYVALPWAWNLVAVGAFVIVLICAEIAAHIKMNASVIALNPVALLCRHRGPTHSILLWLIATLVAGIVIFSTEAVAYSHLSKKLPLWPSEQTLWLMLAAFSVGYISHILADMLTPEGAELLWPIEHNIKFPITIGTTGGAGEYIFTFLCVLYVLWLNIHGYSGDISNLVRGVTGWK